MPISLRIATIIFCLSSLTACSSVHEAMHTKRAEKATFYLTLLPHEQSAMGKTIEIDSKITHIKSRNLITKNNLKPASSDALTFFALDSGFTDLQRIQAKPTSIDGLYNFPFTPHTKNSYRIWAEADLLNTEIPEYPYADIGTKSMGNFTRADILEQTTGGITFTLKLEDKLKRFNTTRLIIEAKDASGANIAVTINDIVGIYSDYRTVIHITPQADKDLNLSPEKEGYIKLFIHLTYNGKKTMLPFTTSIARD